MQKTAIEAGMTLPASPVTGSVKVLRSVSRRPNDNFAKTLLVMKLTIILMTVFLQAYATDGRAQKITLKGSNLPIKKVFSVVERQTGYVVFSNRALLATTQPVTVNAADMPLSDFLTFIFKDQPVSFMIRDKTIVLFEKKVVPPKVTEEEALPALPPVFGRVLGVDGLPLVGATVIVQGTTRSTITASNGSFTIESNPGDVLIVSYVGYITQEYNITRETVDAGKPITFNMVLADIKADELIVVGYGSRTKGATTGAISKVKSEVFENRPLNNALDALQGAVPGMTITRASGQPGNQGYSLQVRGYSSTNGNQPLVLIDGVLSDFNTINPNDIQQISVLKDAAAAIYGARAADGVILVTTKNGRKGEPIVDYTANVGVKVPTYLRRIQNTLQYAGFQDEGLRNAGLQGFSQDVFDKIKANAPPDLNQGWNYGVTNYPGFYGYTNWNDVIYKNATQQLHNIAVSGGGENNNYLVSLGYNKDNGNIRFGKNVSDRYNLRFNYSIRLSKKLSLETRSSFENQVTQEPTLLGSALTNVTRQFPYQPVYNQLGQFYGYQGYEQPAQYLTEGGTRKSILSRVNTNLKADYTLINGLKLTGQAAIRFDYLNDKGNTRTMTRYNYTGGIQDIRNNPNSAYYTNRRTLYKLFQVYADYDKQLGVDHRINITAGTSFEETQSEGQTTTGYNFPSNDIFTLNLADRTQVAYANFTGLYEDQALNSYFGRISYSFKRKYILDLTARADGSSKFAPSERWSAVFPSAAFAYNLSEEPFIKNLNVFNALKLRLSWGKTGNQDIGALGLYDYIPLINIGGVYPIGSPNAGVPGAISSPASSNRTWETVRNQNIGIDLQLLKSRLSFSFDYFKKTNENMLVAIAVPATYGGSPPSSNQGRLETKGFETSITWADKINDFRYSISVFLSDSKNKLVELKNSDSYNEGLNRVREGYSMWSYFGYVYEGIIKTQAQLDAYKAIQGVPSRIAIGDAMFRDVDGDGKLTAFGDPSKGLAGDMVYLGNLLPRYTFSSNISVSYKRFDLGIFLQGVGKRNIQYEGALAIPNTFFWPSLEYYYGKTWSPERPDAKYPRYIPGSVGFGDIISHNYHTSSLTMQNMAYLRFKTITLGYNIPERLTRKVWIQSARVYVSGQDIFTISKGTLGGNFDPEDGFRNEGTYPFNKVFSVGLNVKF